VRPSSMAGYGLRLSTRSVAAGRQVVDPSMARRHPCAPGQVTDSAASHPTAGRPVASGSVPPLRSPRALSPSARVAVGGTQLRAAILPPGRQLLPRPLGRGTGSPGNGGTGGDRRRERARTRFFPAADREAGSRAGSPSERDVRRNERHGPAPGSSRVQGAEASERRRPWRRAVRRRSRRARLISKGAVFGIPGTGEQVAGVLNPSSARLLVPGSQVRSSENDCHQQLDQMIQSFRSDRSSSTTAATAEEEEAEDTGKSSA